VFGVPELPLVVIPHPLGGVDLDGVRARAAVATETVVKLIKAHSQ
jgi:predicted dienelactone hydrolase